MSIQKAQQHGVTPLGYFKGFVSAGCEPDEMGIGAVCAVAVLLLVIHLVWRVLVCGPSTAGIETMWWMVCGRRHAYGDRWGRGRLIRGVL